MTASKTSQKFRGFKKDLYNGGQLFVNQMGGLFLVDAFDGESDELVYHAAYDTLAGAMADAEQWKAWA